MRLLYSWPLLVHSVAVARPHVRRTSTVGGAESGERCSGLLSRQAVEVQSDVMRLCPRATSREERTRLMKDLVAGMVTAGIIAPKEIRNELMVRKEQPRGAWWHAQG
jgi:hypothetical protein